MCILCISQAFRSASRPGRVCLKGSRQGWKAFGVVLGFTHVLAFHGATEASISIELRPSVELKGKTVTLGDIAIIRGSDDLLRNRLESLPLGRAPRSGETVRLNRNTLHRWIRTQMGRLATPISWTGPQEIRLQSASQTLSGELIAEAALAEIKTIYAKTFFRADIRLVEEVSPVSIPLGKLQLKVRNEGQRQSVINQQPQFSKRQVVWVDVWVDAQFIRTVQVGVSISLVAPAYVAARNLSIGEVLGPADLAVLDVEWTGRISNLIEATPAKGGTSPLLVPTTDLEASSVHIFENPTRMRMRHTLAVGEPLTRSHIEPLPLVRQGQFATLRAVEGAIELEIRVEVLQDGGFGQTVRVKVPKAGSSIPVRVSGEGVVEVFP